MLFSSSDQTCGSSAEPSRSNVPQFKFDATGPVRTWYIHWDRAGDICKEGVGGSKMVDGMLGCKPHPFGTSTFKKGCHLDIHSPILSMEILSQSSRSLLDEKKLLG
uniref:Uncharacterized protein n=1 Tax=Micrurus spixii TaxID=129469 RepID=A0A2D4LZU6_9SAUR